MDVIIFQSLSIMAAFLSQHGYHWNLVDL
jgi:hypothetical protein